MRVCIFFFLFATFSVFGQKNLKGKIEFELEPLPFTLIELVELKQQTMTDEMGTFQFINIKHGTYTLLIRSNEIGLQKRTIVHNGVPLKLVLESSMKELDEVVITGTMKEVSKKESTINVEVFSPEFFKKNPTPNIFEALQNVNGVRPQINCNICNTGDIHVNGLEGPYTMILIDGMPIVSSLSTVYGLSGIPNSLVERMEVVKGPSSTLYGSEAIGGVINIITKSPITAPRFSADIFTTSWFESNIDLAASYKIGKKIHAITGINYYNYNLPIDRNEDNFTDVTLQNRISIFHKIKLNRKSRKTFNLAARYVYEDRWGGEMDWNSSYRGSSEIYGESIFTSRWELLGQYEFPFEEKIFLNLSVNNHDQNSFYGTTSFMAKQFIAFGQLFWDKKIHKHDLSLGSTIRYTFYDDDTPATASSDSINNQNIPEIVLLPGIFIQDEIKLSKKHKLLVGIRHDLHSDHGSIFSPRVGYKIDYHPNGNIRVNSGTGYRVVNIYTEDHAALTGAREVVIHEGIRPEQSYNVNLNWNHQFCTDKLAYLNFDLNFFYTYFNNRIIPDYTTNSNFIYYNNLDGHAVSQGVSANFTLKLPFQLSARIGCTYMDVSKFEDGVKTRQLLTEKFSGNWTISYKLRKTGFSFDYTGNLYSPMLLPVLNEIDPRPSSSPWWSIQNLKCSFSKSKWMFYGGVKNLLNWTPSKGIPFLIAGSHDPFDQNVSFDLSGTPLQTTSNPYGLTFDPSYVYAPNQGIRFFIGIQYSY